MNPKTVGKCIYCFTTQSRLAREHVIPVGLNGEIILYEASCEACARVTSHLELEVLRKAYLVPRAALQLRTRRKARRPALHPLVVSEDDHTQTINVPIEDYPCVIATPVFAVPGHLSGISCIDGITLNAADVLQISGPSWEFLGRKYHVPYAGIRIDYRIEEFARFIAKVGYGFAVFELGLAAFQRVYVLPAILGKARDFGQWVGCSEGAALNPTTGLHALHLTTLGNDIIVYVRLFAQFGAREYTVVCGMSA